MTPPIRPILFTLTERGKIVKLRDAVDWYKHIVQNVEPLGDLTALERNYVNGEWGQLIKELAEVQGVPAGMLSYWLNELAVSEIQLITTALEEGAAAAAYGA